MPYLDLPKNNIAEITLIGTGGGYGECCVMHLGNQVWVVVDSCINPETRKSLPLEYLQLIGVNIEKDVDLILCTHWHDDHINGLSALFDAAKRARFSCARANDIKKFLQFLRLDYSKIDGKISNTSTREFNECLQLLRNRGDVFANAQVNTTLARSKFEDVESSIIALSPTDYTLAKFDEEIGSLITEYGEQNKKIVYNSPNAKSVALFIKLGNHRALLGADLEVVINNEKEGWLNILNNKISVDKKASLFKLAHHGSRTGDHDRIWLELLDDNPVAKLTPWNRNDKLPEIEQLQAFCKKSERVFMTSRILSDKPKKRDRDMDKMIKRFNEKLREAKFVQGIVRSRIDLKNPAAVWETDIFDHAFHVNKEIR